MLRKRNKEKERKEGIRRKRERENGGSHAGRMTGLLRRGEESGGYDRRRVQIITIIIFPGNMAAERGWPLGIRAGGKREEEREREDRREEGSQAQAGRVIIILQTTAAGTYLYNPSPSFAFEPSSRSFLPPLVLPSSPFLLLPPALSPSPSACILLAEIRVHGT